MNEITETTDPAEHPETKKRGRPPVAKAAEVETMIPPCPEAEPSMGDKTPAVIAWWFKHHPTEAAARYANRKFELPTDHE